MTLQKITENAYLLPLGPANTVLLDDGGELTLVDAGFPGKAGLVLDAIRELGRQPRDLKHLVFTHGHPDHIGSAAALVRETGATTWMHAADAPFAESGGPFRAMNPSKSLLGRLAYNVMWHPEEAIEPFRVDRLIGDGDTLPVAGGLRAVHAPGHCAGQMVFLWGGRRLLLAGDVGINILTLDDPIGYEDLADLRASQRKVAGLDCDAVVFGHGRPITTNATARLRAKWGKP